MVLKFISMRAKLCIVFTVGFFITATMLVFDMAPKNISCRYEMKSYEDRSVNDNEVGEEFSLDVNELDEALKNPLTSYGGNRTLEMSQMIIATLNEIKFKMVQNISHLKYSDIIKRTMRGEPLLPRPLSIPKKVVIVSTWRSGSTFLEALLGTQPGTFDFYEPLSLLGLVRAKDGEVAEKAQAVVRSLLDCSYDEPSYVEDLLQDTELTTRNPQLNSLCKDKLPGLCTDRLFISHACQLYPWKLMKLVRLSLSLMKPFLEDPLHSNLQVIFLVRDPRAVINSRRSTVSWCKIDENCISPAGLCQDMINDFVSARDFAELFPGRINILRYEDLMSNPFETTKNLFSSIGLDYRPETEEFLKEHTTTELDLPWTTSRNSKNRLLYWTHKMKKVELNDIQKACTKAMRLFGYKTVNRLAGLRLGDVLNPLENDLESIAIK